MFLLLFSFLCQHIEKRSKDQPWDTPTLKNQGEEEDPVEENEEEKSRREEKKQEKGF